MNDLMIVLVIFTQYLGIKNAYWGTGEWRGQNVKAPVKPCEDLGIDHALNCTIQGMNRYKNSSSVVGCNKT